MTYNIYVNALALLASTAALFAPQVQSETIHRSLNEPFMYNGLRYTVTGVRDGVTSYVQRFDQRESTLTPGFKTERLAVVELTVENLGNQPQRFTSILPALTYGDGSVTDHAQWDVEQSSLVRTTSEVQINAQDLYSFGHDPVTVAPAGKAHFAVIFSHPARSKATRFSVQPGQTIVSSGIFITQPASGPTAIVSLE